VQCTSITATTHQAVEPRLGVSKANEVQGVGGACGVPLVTPVRKTSVGNRRDGWLVQSALKEQQGAVANGQVPTAVSVGLA